METYEPIVYHHISKEDQELIKRLKNSDTQAFSEVYFSYWEKFYDISIGFLKDEELAKDIVHDVFFDFWKIRHRLEIKYSIKAYLSVCVKNKCIFVLKQNRKIEIVQIDDLDFITSGYDRLALNDIEKQLNYVLKNKLTEKSRTIFELNRYDNLSYKEIAYRLNLSVKSVEYHMSKALHLLRKSILIIINTILFF